MLWTIVIIFLVLFLIGGVGPWSPGGYGYGYGHVGVGLPVIIFIILVVLLLSGRL